MPETPDLFNEVAIMRDELAEQGAMLDALVRASGTGADILARFQKDPIAAQVLLAVDGSRSQNDIARVVRTSPASVSRALSRLEKDYGLVAISHRHAGGKVYHRTRLDRALLISRRLAQ